MTRVVEEVHLNVVSSSHPAKDPEVERSVRSRASVLGLWAAILTATFSVAWLASVVTQTAVAPVPEWQGVEAYVADFSEWHLLPLYPSLLLALAFLVLVACIHTRTPATRQMWSLSALAVGIVYATMASINYNIQIVSVRRNLLSGHAEGLDMFPLAYQDSITRGLGNSYVYMSLSMFLLAFSFGATRLEGWTKWLLLLAGLAAPLQFIWSMFNTSYLLEMSLIPWTLGAVVASLLIAVTFHRDRVATAEAPLLRATRQGLHA